MLPSCEGKVMISTPGGALHAHALAVISSRRTPSSANNFAQPPSRLLGSMTARAGLRPGTCRTVSCGLSASAVPTPTTTASTSARKPVQMRETGRTVDIVRMTGRGRDPAIERLPDLADDNEIVDRPVPQRAEQISPPLRQRLLATTKEVDKAFPYVGMREFSGGEIAQLHESDQIRGLPVINATIGH